MSGLKFYDAESKAHTDLENVKPSQEEATVAVRKLIRHFMGNGAKVELTFKHGAWSYAGKGHIRLSYSVTWLTLCHEVAHVLDYKARGYSKHDKAMRRKVDMVCRYVRKMGWAVKSLEAQVGVTAPAPDLAQATAA